MQQLLEWLREGRPLTTRLAAEAFEVSRRTIASDIDYLRMVGVPLAYDRQQGTYYLTEDFENLPLAAIRGMDLAVFLVARHALEAFGDTHHAHLLRQVTERLAQHLPKTIHVEPDVLSSAIRFEGGPRPHVRLPQLERLEQAVREQRVVWMRYHSNYRDEETEREVEPYALLSYQGRWYVLGYWVAW